VLLSGEHSEAASSVILGLVIVPGKLAVDDRTGAVVVALRRGLLDLEDAV